MKKADPKDYFWEKWFWDLWRKDPATSMSSLSTQGFIFAMFNAIFEKHPKAPSIKGTPVQLSRKGQCSEEEATSALIEAESIIRSRDAKKRIVDIRRHGTQGEIVEVVYLPREMVASGRESNRDRQKKSREKKKEQPAAPAVRAKTPPKEKPKAEPKTNEPSYSTAKGRTLKGKPLEEFERFWKAFDYRRGKAPAADSWFDLWPDGATAESIIAGAARCAMQRHDIIRDGKTPKMAQGWLKDRRWEDDAAVPAQELPSSIPVAKSLDTKPLAAKDIPKAQKAMDLLRAEIDEESFDLHFKPTKFAMIGGALVLVCVNDLARNWLASHYGDTLRAAIEKAFGIEWDLDVVVGDVFSCDDTEKEKQE